MTGPGVEWAVSGRPIPNERVSGDLHVAAPFPGGALLGVIDGLGHGPEAAVAARAAAAVLSQEPDRPVNTLIRTCHEALRSTRGAVMSLARIDVAKGAVCWGGVGNVEAVLARADPGAQPAREHVLTRSGVVGYQLPALRANDTPIFAGDVLIFASDGVKHGFAEEPLAGRSLEGYAEDLLTLYGKTTDDALILVARFLGPT